MPKTARSLGLYEQTFPPMPFRTWQKQLCSDWFETDTDFVARIIQQPLQMPPSIPDNLTVRAIAVFVRFGVAAVVPECPTCGGNVKFEARSSREWTTYGWTCASVGHKHFEGQINCYGLLQSIPINSWMPFLHLINSLRLEKVWGHIVRELQAGYGNIKDDTFRSWRLLFQRQLAASLVPLDALMVGGDHYTTVCDETVVGVNADDGWVLETRGINKGGARQQRTRPWRMTKMLTKKNILKKHPARTVYNNQMIVPGTHTLRKRPSSNERPVARKRPAASLKRPAANLKNNGKWLWVAVDVGCRKNPLTHANGGKRVTYRLLPRKSDAIDAMPRGLAEIKATLQSRVREGSFLVFDGWLSTRSAARALGYDCAPPVVHEDGYRDPKTGFHTNDVESENARIKRWNRARYGRLNVIADEMDEYIFYTNVGSDMASVFKGLAHGNGGILRNPIL